MLALVYEFYKAYDKAIQKNKSRVKKLLNPIIIVEAQGVQVPCSQTKIIDILGYVHRDKNNIEEMMKAQTFDDMKAWLDLMIGILAPSWLEDGTIIEKKEMNILERFWFGFISSNLMP